MQYSVVSILILIRLIYQVAGQGPPVPPTQTTPSPPTQTTPDPNNPTGTTPDSNNPASCPPGGSSPSGPPPSGPPPSGPPPSGPPPSGPPPSGPPPSGSGTDNLPCIKNILQLCEAYQFQFNKVSEEYYGCTMFTNPFVFAFHTNLVEAVMECDTIMELEVMRQNVMTNKGQPGPSTHAF